MGSDNGTIHSMPVKRSSRESTPRRVNRAREEHRRHHDREQEKKALMSDHEDGSVSGESQSVSSRRSEESRDVYVRKRSSRRRDRYGKSSRDTGSPKYTNYVILLMCLWVMYYAYTTVDTDSIAAMLSGGSEESASQDDEALDVTKKLEAAIAKGDEEEEEDDADSEPSITESETSEGEHEPGSSLWEGLLAGVSDGSSTGDDDKTESITDKDELGDGNTLSADGTEGEASTEDSSLGTDGTAENSSLGTAGTEGETSTEDSALVKLVDSETPSATSEVLQGAETMLNEQISINSSDEISHTGITVGDSFAGNPASNEMSLTSGNNTLSDSSSVMEGDGTGMMGVESSEGSSEMIGVPAGVMQGSEVMTRTEGLMGQEGLNNVLEGDGSVPMQGIGVSQGDGGTVGALEQDQGGWTSTQQQDGSIPIQGIDMSQGDEGTMGAFEPDQMSDGSTMMSEHGIVRPSSNETENMENEAFLTQGENTMKTSGELIANMEDGGSATTLSGLIQQGDGMIAEAPDINGIQMNHMMQSTQNGMTMTNGDVGNEPFMMQSEKTMQTYVDPMANTGGGSAKYATQGSTQEGVGTTQQRTDTNGAQMNNMMQSTETGMTIANENGMQTEQDMMGSGSMTEQGNGMDMIQQKDGSAQGNGMMFQQGGNSMMQDSSMMMQTQFSNGADESSAPQDLMGEPMSSDLDQGVETSTSMANGGTNSMIMSSNRSGTMTSDVNNPIPGGGTTNESTLMMGDVALSAVEETSSKSDLLVGDSTMSGPFGEPQPIGESGMSTGTFQMPQQQSLMDGSSPSLGGGSRGTVGEATNMQMSVMDNLNDPNLYGGGSLGEPSNTAEILQPESVTSNLQMATMNQDQITGSTNSNSFEQGAGGDMFPEGMMREGHLQMAKMEQDQGTGFMNSDAFEQGGGGDMFTDGMSQQGEIVPEGGMGSGFNDEHSEGTVSASFGSAYDPNMDRGETPGGNEMSDLVGSSLSTTEGGQMPIRGMEGATEFTPSMMGGSQTPSVNEMGDQTGGTQSMMNGEVMDSQYGMSDQMGSTSPTSVGAGMGSSSSANMMNQQVAYSEISNSMAMNQLSTTTGGDGAMLQQQQGFNGFSGRRRLTGLRGTNEIEEYVRGHVLYSRLADFGEPMTNQEVPYFFHIHKSGGSTMKHILACMDRVLSRRMNDKDCSDKEDHLHVCNYEFGSVVNADTSSPQGIERATKLGLAKKNFPNLVINTSRIFEALSIFNGHYKGKLFLILRHPIERAVSKYYYTKIATWERNYKPWVQNMTMADFADSSYCYDNWITRRLVHKMKPYETLTQEDLEVAKEILRQKALVLLTTDMSDAANRLSLYFGWPYDDQQGQCANRYAVEEPVNTNPHPLPPRDSPDWKAMEQKNLFDLQLYAYAEQLYHEQGASLSQRQQPYSPKSFHR